MIRQLFPPLLLVILIIASTLLAGCRGQVFLTVFAEPTTIAPGETSSITTVVTRGKNATSAKPVEGATVAIWIPQNEKAFAQLSETTVTTDGQGSAGVKLKAVDTSPNKTIHVKVKVKDKTSNCTVIITKRPVETTEEQGE